MNSVNEPYKAAEFRQVFYWVPIAIGLLAMYLPTFFNLSETIWKTSDQGHGPIVLMIVCFLFWQKRTTFVINGDENNNLFLGFLLFFISLAFYILGRSQDIIMFDVGSLILIIIALILILKGHRVLKQVWFPLFFLLFTIPLPGVLLDSVTMPMKMAVSAVAENVLYWFDYPIARNGVILQIGQYQLLVADACAGMHTLISLEALGLLYLNLVKHDSFFRNVSLAILIIPISFTANVVRVMILTLITYYFGDAAGQGFVHGLAGMVLFIVALILIISVDSLLQYMSKKFTLLTGNTKNQ